MTDTDSTTPDNIMTAMPDVAEQRRQREKDADAVLNGFVAPDSDPADPAPWLAAAERMNSDQEFRERMLDARCILEMDGCTEEEWIAEHDESLKDDEYYREEWPKGITKDFQARARAAEFLPIVINALPEITREFDAGYTTLPVNRWSLISFTCPECGSEDNPIVAGVDANPSMPIRFMHEEMYAAYRAGCHMTQNKMLELLGLTSFIRGEGYDLSFLDDDTVGQEDSIDWLIPGMFARGDYWSLFGPNEVGKSLLALDWALRMARNGERVLYLDKENPSHVLNARFKKMGARRQDFVNLSMKQFPEIADLATEAGGTQLMEMVRKHKATVVILDTISKFSQLGQATQSDRWQKIYDKSIEPLLRIGVTPGQLDHTGLGDKTRERDSNAKRDNVSVAWALTWRGKDRLTLSRAKNRPHYSSPGSIAVERRDEPILTHIFGESVPDDIRRALDELERLNVPARAGRPAARAALDAAGVSMADKVLEQAIRVRKAA